MPPIFRGEAVQVVSLYGPRDKRKLKLETQVLRSITNEAGGYNIVVIAIAGPARGGKSFILTYIIRYLTALERATNGDAGDWMEVNDPNKSMKEKGFNFQNGPIRTTDGIWMWSRPFIVQTSPNREKIAVIVIDTEGCFDATATEKDQSSIIGLSLLASSCFIFNESTKINENTLMTLAKFMQYGQLATQSFDDKSFQQLMFLVRDWNMPDTHLFGAAGGKAFMEASMVPNSDMSSEAIDCRNAIRKCFEQLDAYLMPHPGYAVLANSFTGSIGEMDEHFRKHISEFVVGLVADVSMKKVNNTSIDGTSFYNLFESHVAAFNSDGMPNPASILQANLLVAFESILRKLVSTYQDKFKEKLSKNELEFQPSDKLQNWNDNIAKQIMQAFDQKANKGSPEDKKTYTQKLRDDLDRCFFVFQKDNEEKKNSFIESTQSTSLKKFKEYIEKSILPAAKFWTQDEFNRAISTAENRAHSKFLLACTGMPENFVNVQQILFSSKLEEIKNGYWGDLNIKRMSAEEELSDILKEIKADYDDFMAAATKDAIVAEQVLDAAHERQLSSATQRFERRVAHIPDTDFLQTFFEDLTRSLNSKYQDIKSANQSGTESYLTQIENDIEEAVALFREELNELIPHTHPSDFSSFDVNYNEFLDIGTEQIDKLAAISGTIRLEYLRRLERSLQEVVTEARETVYSSRMSRHERCQQFVQSTVNQFTTQLDQITQNYHLLSSEELTCRITSIYDTTRASLQSNILAEDPDEVNNYLSEYDQLAELEQQKVKLENLERLTRFENDALDLSAVLAGDYVKYMDNYQANECTSIEELSHKHSQMVADLTDNYETDLRNKYHNDKLATPCVERLTAELASKFENVRLQFEDKLQREQELKRQVLDETVHNFEQSVMSRIDGNPFISMRQFETALDDEDEKCVHEFKRNSSFNASGKKIKNDLLGKLTKKINSVREELRDYKKGATSKAQKAIDDLIEDTCAEAETQIKLKIDSSKLQETSWLETVVTSVKQDVKTYFENAWVMKDENQKVKAWEEVEFRVNPCIQNAKEALIERISKQKIQARIAGEDAIVKTAAFLEQSITAGKIFSTESLAKAFEESSSTAKTEFELYCTTNDFMPTDEDRKHNSDKIKEFEKRMKQQNEQNREKVLIEITDLCKRLFNEGKTACNTETTLLQLKTRVLDQCLSQLQDKCSEDSSKTDDLKEKITHICNEMYEKVDEDKKASVNSNLILKHAVRDYCTEMDAKLKGVTSIDPKVLANYHLGIVNQIIRDATAQSLIPKDLEAEIESRLKSSFKIYDNKYILSNNRKNVAVGIDLGTTTSCVAISRGDSKVEVITDNSGNSLIPSYVCFQPGEAAKVGKAAKDESHLYPENTIFDSKRLIGREFWDDTVQEDMKTWPFKIVNRNGKPKIVACSKEYDPEDISAYILKHMKKLASDRLGVEVKQAVITVPANFTDRQRDATRQAAQIAGLEVLQIINEPTAAAMAYTLNTSHEDKNVLVYDFGGGTFDVTILKASGANLKVLTTMGDTHLGGEDFDHNMVLHCAKKFEARHPWIQLLKVGDENNIKDVQGVKRRIIRLRGYCEKAKATLSVGESATVHIDAITKDGLDLSVTITKTEFEDMNMALFQKSIDIVAAAINKVNLRPEDINDVLMVGGSSRIPKIKDMLGKYLGMRNLIINDEVDIQEAVARGAATQACILSGGSAAKYIQDVIPYSLGES